MLRVRRGTTLIELLIFMAILGMVVSITLPLLFSATENRLLQTTISIVEQNGAQVLSNMTRRVHAAEKILSPLPGQTGSVLVLQTASGSTDPTIIGIHSGAIIILEHLTQETVSTEQVAVTRFVVQNTSTSASRQSVLVSFTVSRTIRLQTPHNYARSFETTLSLFPTDYSMGNACGCLAPSCEANDVYTWNVCESGVCYQAETILECP